jgi:hypothetical protein
MIIICLFTVCGISYKALKLKEIAININNIYKEIK